MNKILAAGERLYANRVEAAAHHGLDGLTWTPPSPEHYPHRYLWDSAFFSIIYARVATENHGLGNAAQAAIYARRAVEESISLFEGQQPDGMIPNIHFAQNGRNKDPEALLSFPENARGSNYSQPPVLALAVREVYDALKAVNPTESDYYLDHVFAPLQRSMDYWIGARSNGPLSPNSSLLIGIVHPHETGRDSDPTYNYLKPFRFRRKGPNTSQVKDKINAALDYGQILLHGANIKPYTGAIERAREIFWANDVMMNCIYVDNLHELAMLAELKGDSESSSGYKILAASIEEQIHGSMWQDNENIQGYFSLNEAGEAIDEVSIGNLFALVLPNIDEAKLSTVLDLMDASFDTNYPLPSVAISSPNYDPDNQQTHRLWQGPTWLNTNWYLVERGLNRQVARNDLSGVSKARCEKWISKIRDRSIEMVDKHGPREYNHPETGKPHRPRVREFGWSNLAYFMSDK